MTMQRLFFLLHFLFALAFALSVAVQYNDPDPLPWMLVYGAGCVVSVWALLGSPPRALGLAIVAVCLGWGAILLRQAAQSQLPVSLEAVFGNVSMKNERVELIREVGGLGIVAFWMLVTALRGPRS